MEEQTIDTKQFILVMRQIAEEKNLPFEVVQDALEHALAAAYRKDYGTREQNVRTSLNPTTGDFRVWVVKDVVKEVEDSETQISLEDAKKTDSKAKVEGTVEFEKEAKGFGRVAAQTAKQVILQKLREAEREVVHAEYSGRIGTILNATVQRVEPKVVYCDLGKAQGILPASEQIPNEIYSAGQRLKAYLRDVEMSARGPQLVLSRANPDFISLLFKREVPEMENDAVEIKAIAREAGVRTKIAVASNVPGVDPVGTFVGGHGTRVQAVMNEVGEEKIDIIMFAEDAKTFITNALSPTSITKVELDEKDQRATVIVPEDQLSIAIGKSGQNVRIASKLTGWQIDIQNETGKPKESDQPAPVAAPIAEKPSAESVTSPVAAAPTKVEPYKSKKPASKADLEAALIESVAEVGDEGGQHVAAGESSEQLSEPKADAASEDSVAVESGVTDVPTTESEPTPEVATEDDHTEDTKTT